jgi:hypothetical protein
MKNLLVVLAVLAVATVANANLTLSVVGQNLSISTDTAIAAGGGLETYYALVVPTASGTLSGGSPAIALTDAGWDVAVYNDAVNTGGIPVPTGTNGVWGEFFTTGGAIPQGALISGVTYAGKTPVVATLYAVNGSDWSLGAQLSQVNITPEPATMVLLGIGGLLFARKK